MAINKSNSDSYEKKKLIKLMNHNLKQLDFFEEIEITILFGSRARGDNNLKSDLDIALLLASNFFEKINEIDIRIDLSNYFSELTGLESDIIILNSAKPLLKFQILKYGEIIYVKDDFSYASYFSKSLKEYFDFKYYKEYHYKKMKERLLKSE